MTVQRYHSWDSEDDEDGHYVAHDDYAALLKDRDALAVENAKAKSVLKQCQEYFIAGIRNEIRPTNEGYLHMICDTFADENPATDAAIANIQAQGADAVAAHHHKQAELLTGPYSEMLHVHRYGCNAAKHVAAQLRKGGTHD